MVVMESPLSMVIFPSMKDKTMRVQGKSIIVTGSGGGIGAGGSVGGASSPHISTGEIPYSPITCINPFSMRDLHNSVGSIVSGGLSTIVGLSYTLIAATSLDTAYFERQGGLSGSLGVGIGGTAFVGIWKVGRICALGARERGRELGRQL